MNTSSSSAATNRPPCTSCGSFSSHKRLSSENPTAHLEPKPKKPHNGTHSVFDFSKIPHYSPTFLRRRYKPTLPPVLEESRLSTEPVSHVTSKRMVSDPMPSPAKTFSNKCLRKMRDCMREMRRKWDDSLGNEEDAANEDTHNSNAVNKLSHNTMDNSEEEYVVEAVSVEKKGEALILDFKCPCGSGYQIILSRGNCYYKLM